MEDVVKLVEELGVKIPHQVKETNSPTSIGNYLKGRARVIKIQISALEDKIAFLEKQLEEKKKQLKVLEDVIEELEVK